MEQVGALIWLVTWGSQSMPLPAVKWALVLERSTAYLMQQVFHCVLHLKGCNKIYKPTLEDKPFAGIQKDPKREGPRNCYHHLGEWYMHTNTIQKPSWYLTIQAKHTDLKYIPDKVRRSGDDMLEFRVVNCAILINIWLFKDLREKKIKDVIR